MDEMVFIFKDDTGSLQLTNTEGDPLMFIDVLHAVKYLLDTGHTDDMILSYHYSYANGFVSLPCSLWTIIKARQMGEPVEA